MPNLDHSSAPVGPAVDFNQSVQSQELDQSLRQSVLALLATGASVCEIASVFRETGVPAMEIITTMALVAQDGSLPPREAINIMQEAGCALFDLARNTPEWDGMKAKTDLKALGVEPICLVSGGMAASMPSTAWKNYADQTMRFVGGLPPNYGIDGWSVDGGGRLQWGGPLYAAHGRGPHAVPPCLPGGGSIHVGSRTLDERARVTFTLPDGLISGQDLALCGMAGFTSIPRGLWVAGDLLLEDCSDLETLGPAMTVSGGFQIYDCRRWDGRIPLDAKIGGKIFTPVHKTGTTLDQWRALHPHGELA